MTKSKIRILFVCTGNACRSQMAEGWARHFGGDQVDIASAGIKAHGLNPKAVAAMREVGVDISAQESQRLKPEVLSDAHIIVTVCDHAAETLGVPETCHSLHWSLPDPAQAIGNEKQTQEQFRNVRDHLKHKVETLLDNFVSV